MDKVYADIFAHQRFFHNPIDVFFSVHKREFPAVPNQTFAFERHFQVRDVYVKLVRRYDMAVYGIISTYDAYSSATYYAFYKIGDFQLEI